MKIIDIFINMGNKITQIYPEKETKPIFRDQNEWSWPKVTKDQIMMIVKDFFSRNNFSEEEIKLYIKHPELIGNVNFNL